jgi:hypothetical protein
MLKELVLQEIKLNLLSFRFWVMFIFVIIVSITGSIVFSEKFQEEQIEYQSKQKNKVITK